MAAMRWLLDDLAVCVHLTPEKKIFITVSINLVIIVYYETDGRCFNGKSALCLESAFSSFGQLPLCFEQQAAENYLNAYREREVNLRGAAIKHLMVT